MKKIYSSRLSHCAGLLMVALLWLANSSNPPTGRTGAPFDGHCSNCHSGGSFNGDVTVMGMPALIEPNTTYPISLTMAPTAGNPFRGGFQLVAVDGNNVNAGNLAAINAQTGTEMASGREYIEHRGAKNFNGDPISWDFNWMSPGSAAGNTIKFYFVGNFTNGNGNTSGDLAISFSETYAFTGPPPVSATISTTSDVSCNGGSDGSATVTPGGGNQPYTYLWSIGNQTGQTVNNLIAGTYTVTVTGSGGSGSATATTVITQPTAIVVNVSVVGSINCSQSSVTATASASGGAGQYTYAWSNLNTANPATYFNGGAHSLTVTDANGCTKVSLFNIIQNTTPPTATATAGIISCSQPTTTVQASSSTTNAVYAWSGPNTFTSSQQTATVNAAGTYTVTVTNPVNGCTNTATATVTGNAAPPTATASGGAISCTNSSVQLTAGTNASQPGFLWSGPCITSANQNQQNPVVNCSGTFTVVVTNMLTGCTNTATAIVTQNTTPPTLSITAGGPLTCTTTSVAVMTTTNAQNPIFNWSGPGGFTATTQNINVQVPGSYTVTVTSPGTGCTATAVATVVQNSTPPSVSTMPSGPLTCTTTSVAVTTTTNATNATFSWAGPGGFTASTQNINVQAPGSYTVIVTSTANGCTSTAVATVTQNTVPPIVSIATPGILNCNTGTIQLNGLASSQGNNFTYAWTTTNGSIVSGATTLTPTINASGIYNLLITNTSNGCTATAAITVTLAPAPSAAVTNIIHVACFGGTTGSATVTATGGTGPYTPLWSNSTMTATNTNLPAGTYTVTVTDGNGCTATASVTINQPPVLVVTASATPQTAIGVNNGTASAVAAGGTGVYAYLWSNTATTPNITGLAPGTYTVKVTDANGCTAVKAVTVNSVTCNVLATVTATQVRCQGAADGSATVNLTGATAPVTYLWSNGMITAAINGLIAGNYQVSVTDGNGCSVVGSTSIMEPATLNANATATAVTAANLNDGQAIAQPTGGTAPYTYVWNTGAATPAISGLMPGNYTVTIVDANSCTVMQTIVVNAFNCALITSVSTTNATCLESANGSATVVVAGGSAPYAYVWSNGSSLATAANLLAGMYAVTVMDMAGCTSHAAATVTVADIVAPTLGCPGDISLCGANLVTYVLPVITDNCGLTGVFPTLVSGQASGSAFNDGVTTQVFSVIDAAGNTATCSFTITVFPLPDILVDSMHNDVGNGGLGSVGITATGGAGPYTFIWKKDGVFFSSAEDLTGLQAGTYLLAITDANGCEGALVSIIIDNIVGTRNPLLASIRVWPNPAKTGIWVKMNDVDALSAEMWNMQGRLVQTIMPAELSDFIAVEDLPDGIYYLKIVDATGKTWVARWVKSN